MCIRDSSKRAALVLARIGAALGSDAGPFFAWVLLGVETQAAQDPIRLSIHLSVLSQTLQLGQRDCLHPFVQVASSLGFLVALPGSDSGSAGTRI
eukprot:2576104-Rhodomonas_salina.1